MIALALAAMLALLLIGAAGSDLRDRTIPNSITLGIALGAPLWWWATGVGVWPGAAIQLGFAVILFAVFAGAFAIGAMGGGDVKLISALALWVPLTLTLDMLLVMAVAGGVLTLVMLLVHRLRRSAGRPEIPYGVAIAIAGLWAVANQNLTSSVH